MRPDPDNWEARLALFVAYMIDRGVQSATIRSYMSAIRKLLSVDGYEWKHDGILFSSLTRACKLENDRLWIRMPIHCGLLELLLFEIQKMFKKNHQWYNEVMYKAMFAMGYYGLLRVGELTKSDHVLKACNIHVALNKEKMLLVLYSSKTHDKSQQPQRIKIVANNIERIGSYKNRHFCPFKLLMHFISLRGDFKNEDEQFFVFNGKIPVSADNAHAVLRTAINGLGLNGLLYDMHSLCKGRATDLFKYKYPVDEIKKLGRWHSNVVYKYIRS